VGKTLSPNKVQGKEMRVKILESATELFMKEGLYNVTLQQIADAVKITQPAIYRHFKNMDDIILSACKHWVLTSVSEIRPGEELLLSANEQLKKYFERHFQYAFKNRSHDGLLLGLYYYSMRSTEMLAFYKEIKSKATLHLSLVLKMGHLERIWDVEEPAEVAETLHSLVVAETIKILIEPKAFPLSERINRIYQHVGKILGNSSWTKQSP